ncbi:TonB-dependent receptor plug domain-containing protein [Pseudoalteromonas sp. MTN2-4]|uniref:TonB-dependent receptor plug domain-containing protein n=1 Tax=Pseudoalteromonas sp. MTN2-4 TaxID=3056555 RepID=UPI0036F3133E
MLFLLDGHKIYGPRSGNAAHLAKFALAHIERLEIIRGPGSSIYGSNAFTGVINIITKKPKSRSV